MGAFRTPEDFKADCRKHFHFLVTDFDFVEQPLPRDASVNRYQVRYVNSTTLVVIEGLHWGTFVGVGLGRVQRERYELETYPLDKLLLIRHPEAALVGPGGFPTNQDQEFQVPHYAQALREGGTDILRGDFTVWAEFRKKPWPRKKTPKSPGRRT
jgi:hypothetical protein